MLTSRLVICLLLGTARFVSAQQTLLDLSDCGSQKVTIGNPKPDLIEAAIGLHVPNPIGKYQICNTYTMLTFDGQIDWGKEVGTIIPGAFQTTDNAILKADHIYTKGGRYDVAVKVWSTCHDVIQGNWKAVSCGRGTAIVYETQAISTLVLNPPTLTGGSLAKATVTLQVPSPAGGQGTLVSIGTSSGLITVPGAVIVTPTASTVSFDISTSTVTVATPVTITVTSGGSSLSQILTLTP